MLRIRRSLLLQCAAPFGCRVFSVVDFFSLSLLLGTAFLFPLVSWSRESAIIIPASYPRREVPLHSSTVWTERQLLLLGRLDFLVFQPLLTADFWSPDPIHCKARKLLFSTLKKAFFFFFCLKNADVLKIKENIWYIWYVFKYFC